MSARALAVAAALGGAIACKGGSSSPGSLVEGSAAAAPATPAPAPADTAGARITYDFLANRVHALTHHEGRLILAAGEVDFLKFVDGGWKSNWFAGEKDGGKPAALPSGLSGTFFVPIDTDGDGVGGQALADLKMRLTMRSLAPNQKLTVFANEKPVGTLDVTTTAASYEVTVPAANLVVGENRFRLTFKAAAALAGGRRSPAAIQRIELGATAAAPDAAPPAPLVREVDVGGSRRRSLTASGPARLSFYVQVPARARLVAGYGSTAAGATALVRLARDGAAAVPLFEGKTAQGWSEGSWDLAPYADQTVRIDLVSRGGAVAWATPRIVVAAPAPAPAPAPKKFERIFVWMVDTLRADKLRVYNPKTIVESPNYDAFAADATRFAWAHVPGTWSLPSHASILTGVYPTIHKATAHEARLAPQVPFVAELLKKAGYRTAMFSSNGYVSGKWGFDRGWDINRNFIRESLPNGADYLWKHAKTWIDANGKRPQYAYLATIEPHVVYNPKKEFLVKYWKKPYKGPIKPQISGVQLGHIKSGKLKINDNDKAYLEALHNAEITQSDHFFGQFIADLKASGLYDTSVIIVTSDHGDEFWEHGDVGHAQSVHQELVHVPLIIRAPGLYPQGKVVEADVESMDLFPTVLELAGLTPPPGTQGVSLLALAHDELSSGPRVALSQNLQLTRGIKSGRFRFIHPGSAKLELYDEIKDPLEQQNLADKRPIALRQMRNVFSLIVAFENKWKKAQWGTAANVSESFYAAVRS
jgi:choline-sulfatase